ncbi:L,D-transpeptidase family protein [Planctomicrobium sp.]|jgi:hypothetical protein|nr:L,D-transpeptidase family protein [Planctomicrobium sp.]
MFEYQPSRHPLQTFQFWFAVLVCAGGVAIWRFGGFGSSDQVAEKEISYGENFEEELPPPPFDQLDLGESFELTGLSPAPLQNEEQSSSSFMQSSAGFAGATDTESASPQAKPFPGSSHLQPEQAPQNFELSSTEGNILRLSGEESQSEVPLKTASLDLPNLNQSVSPLAVTSTGIDLVEIDEMIAAGDDVIALRKLSTIYWQSPEQRSAIRGRLEQLSRRIYFQPQPHYMDPYEVQFGERLELIAKKYEVPWQYLEKLNRIDAQRLRAGKKLKVIQGPFNVVVDLSNFEATVHAHGYFVVRMPVGIGKDGTTPVGTFKVTDKVEDPIYYGPDGVIKNDDPLNPLGEYWIAISDEAKTLQGYGLHGTIDPSSIGKSESKGCVRFHDQDISDLYHLLTIGSEVTIRR